MLCRTVDSSLQVWPGRAIEVFEFRKVGTTLTLLSAFSNYLNQELWYFAPNAATSDDGEFMVRPVIGVGGVVETPNSVEYVESYRDRAILTDIDWIPYAEPISSVGYGQTTFRAELVPLRLDTPSRPGSYAVGTPTPVWVQFWTLDRALMLVVWYFSGEIQWTPTRTGFPSAFQISEHGDPFLPVSSSDIPRSGWMHVGGQRPAPWPESGGSTGPVKT